MDTNVIAPEIQYPSVDLAYEFIVARSYDWMIGRINALDGRLQSFQSLAVTVMLGVPVLVKSLLPSADFLSGLFIGGMSLFGSVIVLGAIGRYSSKISLPYPDKFYDHWLHFSPWEFRKNLLYYAGRDALRNLDSLERKGKILDVMTMAFLVGIVLLLIWINR